MTVKVQLLRSTTASKRPTASALLDGELALNTNSGTTGVFFEDSTGNIRKIGPVEVGGASPNASPAAGGANGNSVGEQWYDTNNSGGNGLDVLKTFNGTSFVGPGSVTIGTTDISVGTTGSAALAGLSTVAGDAFTATDGFSASNQGYLELKEQSLNGSNYIRLVAPDSVTNNTTFKFPDGDGSNKNVLVTDGAGNLSWSAPAGTTVQTQDAGNSNASHFLTFVDTNNPNGSPVDELVFTDPSISYNPGTNLLSLVSADISSQLSVTTLVLDGTTITATGNEINILDGATLSTSELNILDGATLTTTELNYVDGVTSAIQTQLNNKGSLNNQNALISLSGVSAGSTDLGTFSGSTISDNETVKEALQDLETTLEAVAGGGAQAASIATITDNTDSTQFLTFVADDNVASTQEFVKTDAGISYNPSSNILTVSGSINADLTGDVTGNATSSDTVDVTADDSTNTSYNILFTDGSGSGKTIREDSGLIYNPAANTLTTSEFMGDLTGDVTGDASSSSKIKTVKSSTNSAHYLTFVDSNNTSATAESLYTDAGVTYNPSSDLLNVTGTLHTQFLTLDNVNVNASANEINILDGATLSTAELNILDGLTASTSELNILDGATLTTTELNYVDGVTSNIQTQLDTKQHNLTGGNGIEIANNTVAVDLTTSDQTLTLAGYASAPESFLNDDYDIIAFQGTVSGSAGSNSLTWASNSSYNIYTDSVGSRFIAYNTTESSWLAIYTPFGIGTPSDGGSVSVSTSAYDLPTANSITVNGANSPQASAWPEATYSSTQDPFLAFSGGKLYAMALDEDDMASNSSSHLATQQSIKAYVDAIDKDRIIDGDTNVTVDGTNDTVIFTTNGTAKWVIGTNGHFLPITDSAFDFGAANNEIRNLYADSIFGTLQTASQTNITGVGTLTAGTWRANVVEPEFGGTGLNGASAANGKLLIGNGSGYTLAGLTGGQSVTITEASGSITISSDFATSTATSGAANAGVASFNSSFFTVDGSGFVTPTGGFGLTSINADSGTTSPSGNGITIAGGTGLSTSGSGSSLTIALDDTAVTAAGYGSADTIGTFTVDSQGRLTAAADVLISILHTQVSDFDAGVQTNRLDQMAVPTSAVSLNSQKITNLADPVADQDAATKKYVDDTAQGLNTKKSVEVATTSALGIAYTYDNGTDGEGATITADANGVVTIDGEALTVNERVLIKDETSSNQPYNGIYVVSTVGTVSAALVLTRAEDQDADNEFAGAYVFVESGASNANNGYVCTAEDPFTVGTTNVTWEQFSGAGQVEAGLGLTKSGNTLNVGGTADRITVTADAVDIASTYAGQTSITTLGTIATGVWNGTIVGTAFGGSGADGSNVTASHALIAPNGSNGAVSYREILPTDIGPVSGGSFDAGSY